MQQMDEYDIEKVVLCALNNEETQAAIRKHFHRLTGLVWINPWNGNKAVDEAKRYIEKVVKLCQFCIIYLASEGLNF